jgi:hypothetical protein
MDSQSTEALYLKGECCLMYGSATIHKVIDQLRTLGNTTGADILRLKLLLFLGDSRFENELARCRSRYPDSPEVRLAAWLHSLDQTGAPPDPAEVSELAEQITMSAVPYQAAYTAASDRTDREALSFLTSYLPYAVSYFHRHKQKLETRLALDPQFTITGAVTLEYAQCGAQAGMYLVDTDGNKIKISLDTGTGGRLFTVHHRDVGDRLHGDTMLVLEDGIQYNYMDAPADVVIKGVDFAQPSMTSFPVEYFDGGFSIADGCFSPFALRDVAIVMDPVNQRVTLRDSAAFVAWVDSLPAGAFADLPVILRDSWPYIPIEVNGYRTLMMVETGSRDVNFNEIAVEEYGLVPYDSAIIWRGEEYPTNMVDVTIRVGHYEYEVQGGHVTDWALGNHAYGLAAAGDIGPDFMNRFVYSFDPWRRRLILVDPKLVG